MTTDTRLDKTQQIFQWMLNFCLKSSVEAFQDSDLRRGEAFLRVAIVVLELLDEGTLEEDRFGNHRFS